MFDEGATAIAFAQAGSLLHPDGIAIELEFDLGIGQEVSFRRIGRGIVTWPLLVILK